ncbi:MAG: hypothetical protein QXU97_00120 [Fervidicoccaceae archaeon]
MRARALLVLAALTSVGLALMLVRMMLGLVELLIVLALVLGLLVSLTLGRSR